MMNYRFGEERGPDGQFEQRVTLSFGTRPRPTQLRYADPRGLQFEVKIDWAPDVPEITVARWSWDGQQWRPMRPGLWTFDPTHTLCLTLYFT